LASFSFIIVNLKRGWILPEQQRNLRYVAPYTRYFSGPGSEGAVAKALLEVLPKPAAFLSGGGLIVAANRRLLSCLNLEEPEIVEKRGADLFSIDTWRRCRPVLAVAKNGGYAEVRGSLASCDGRYLSRGASCTPILTEAGGGLILFQLHTDENGNRTSFGAPLSGFPKTFPDEVLAFDTLQGEGHMVAGLEQATGGTLDPGELREAVERCRRGEVQALYVPVDIQDREMGLAPGTSEVRLLPHEDEDAGSSGVLAIIRRNMDSPHKVAEHKRMAYRDSLTDLLNRRAFLEALDRGLEDLGPADPVGLAVFYIDLDAFKKVNDQGGHEAGDEMLKAVARALSAEIPDGGQAARIGGDEFAALCKAGSAEDAFDLGTRIQGAFSKIRVTAGCRTFTIAGSIGVAFMDAGLSAEVFDPGLLMKLADSACLRGKRIGGRACQVNRVDKADLVKALPSVPVSG
jgi:diguanylate cyclase (GGDEF)-like protein